VAQLNKEKIPSISGDLRPAADIGFLAAYSDDPKKLAEVASKKVDMILKGASVSAVPVDFSKDVIFELNLATAKLIGINIPADILARANKVYNQ
jgi:putative ABC transport system substrate-binding protein